MDKLFQELYNCLTRQEKIIDKLIAAGNEQMMALRRNDVAALEGALSRLGAAIAEMEKEEPVFLEKLSMIKSSLGLSEELPLRNDVEYAPEEIKPELKRRYLSLHDKAIRLEEIQHINTLLTKNAISFNNRMLRLILKTNGNTYSGNGKVQSRHNTTLLNRTI